MKKKTLKVTSKRNHRFYPLLLCTALACTACGADNQAEQNTSQESGQTSTSDTVDNNQPPQTEDGGQTEEDNKQAEEANGQTPEPDTSASKPDTSVSPVETNITIDIHQDSEEVTADDGTVLLTKSYSYPVITIEGNDAAAEKINADIRSRVESFRADRESEEWAKGGYVDSQDSEYDFIPYIEDLSFGIQRADSNVISFVKSAYSFTGGAHGNYGSGGINFNTKTGDIIAFSDLSDDAVAFHEDTLAYNQSLAKTESYQERMFSSDFLSSDSLESVLYADDKWYLSTEGLVFISNPYELGPYVAGTIEFVIPYSDLADMGFKDSFAYTGRLIQKLQEDVTYNSDLNGDGIQDNISIHVENTEKPDGSYTAVPYLTINGKEFIGNGENALLELTEGNGENYSWPLLSLYDLNVEDQYVDLVFLSDILIENQHSSYSYFYRYMEDGSLVYLGKAQGDVNDPLVTVDFVE